MLIVDERQAERARKRRSWPIRKFRLGQEPDEDLSATTTPEQRLGMMWPLAVDAWMLGGREIPDYRREDTPGQVMRAANSRAR